VSETPPLVSVILATYRRGHVIGRALRSVLAQSVRDLEVLVLDDVPGDETEAVVRSMCDPRVHYISHPSRRGVAAARNQGLALARGKYVAFQDSDDEWLADKLAHQVGRLESAPAGVALTQAAVLHYDLDSAAYFLSDLPEGQEATAILRCNMTSFTQGWLVRKAALQAVGGFDERLPLWEDWELMIRICQDFRVDLDRHPVALVYDTPGGLTAQVAERVPALQRIIDKHGAAMERQPRILAFNLYLMARLELTAGRAGEGLRLLIRSLRLDPRHLKAWALLVAAPGGARFVNWLGRWRSRQRRKLGIGWGGT
jgi:glycosyltransferase involved in cell wall biosynthesis